MSVVKQEAVSLPQPPIQAEELPYLDPPRFEKSEKYILLLADAVALWAALAIGRMAHLLPGDYTLINGFASMLGGVEPQRLVSFSFLMLIALASFISAGHYSLRRPIWDEFGSVIKILLILSIVDFAIGFVIEQDFSRVWHLSTWGFALALIPVARFGIKKTLVHLGGWIRPCVIIGIGRNAAEAASALTSEKLLGYRVGAYLSPYANWGISADESITESEVPIIPLDKDPIKIIKRMGNPHVFVALEAGMFQRHQKLISSLIRQYSDIYIVPAIRGLPLQDMDAMHFFSHEVLLLNARNNLARIWSRTIKRSFDIVVALLLALFYLPAFIIISWRVGRDGGPIMYAHDRIGKDGGVFKCLKFRTMRPNADQILKEYLASNAGARKQWEYDHKLKDDPRTTAFGKKLRHCSLDELPQLWNVLKGEMSLVGPRPITEEELHRYGEDLDYYLFVRPGITGLWQTSGRNDTDYTSRIALDAWYVRNWSLWYDIVILLKTIKVVFSRKGAY
jgi:Undecaprenyl-phosphate galactose phosphotransferase WbaP